MDLDLTRDLAAKASAAVAAVASASLDTLRSTLTAPFASAPAHGTPLRKAHSSDADLLAHAVDSPDERRRPSSSSGGRTATDGSAPWHVRALAAARAAAPSLTDVAAMRFAYVDEDAAGPAGEAVVVVVAAHVRTAALTRREVVLLASLVADKALAGGRRYIVVVYGDGAEDMAYVYAGEFFASLHAALPPAHRTALAALYVLAPPLQLRLWLLGLRLSEPLVYAQAKVVASLAELERRFAGGRPPAPPDCAAVADAARAAAAEREGRI
jgi:hypothetical protein